MTRARPGKPSTLPRITDLAARIAAGESFAAICAELGAPRATLSSRFTQAGFSTVTGLSVLRVKRTETTRRVDEPWMEHAVCRECDPEAWFPDKGEDHVSPRRICESSCKVRLQCLDYAMRLEEGLSRKSRVGVFGGLTPEQRAEHEPVWLAERNGSAA
jgi:WhiB family redox-sensing transcriptional regulator